MRKIFIHAGLPKTGTSAFQTFCGRNVSFLKEELGIVYPDYCGSIDASAKGATTSGNGLAISAALGSPFTRAPEILEQGRCQINEIFDGSLGTTGEDFLLSSEWFSAVPPENFQQFAKKCEQNGMEFHLIFVVRDLFPWVYSLYGQAVKGGLCACRFDEYFTGDKLELLRNVLGAGQLQETQASFSMSVLNYQDIKSAVGKSILDSVLERKGPKDWPSEDKKKRMNRSLSPVELEIIRRANSILPPIYGRSLARFLISRNPNKNVSNAGIDFGFVEQQVRSECFKISAKINTLVLGTPIRAESVNSL
jgi:hypothetical protein